MGIVQAIDGFFETFAHLDFVDKDKIALTLDVAVLDVLIESVIFLQKFKIEAIEIDLDDIGVGDIASDILLKIVE